MPDLLTRRVAKAWRASYSPALKLRAGEAITPIRTDTEYPGWHWVENAKGLGGWIPSAILRDDVALEAFDSTELTVTEGDEVQILSIRQGWVRCRAANDDTGWLPATCLAPA